ncbi:TRAP transporter large permease [Roseinatronobacter sp. NSM]|uniref:TRAP transporter large permease n=1 Tax=Roseinatronobacter sp. NSM TaxID=3457785 RepID=UPI004036C2A9
MDILVTYLPLVMFATLAILAFTGYPIAFVLGGVALLFAVLGDTLGSFRLSQLTLIPLRIYGSTMESLVLVAIPMFIFMGTMLEKSGAAKDLLHALQVMFRKTPGGLALAVTLVGTIMAATTGIIGASVVMVTMMALPVMMRANYNIPLATGTIAASGTLGVLVPPSIMLVIMADLMAVPAGTLFIAAFIPGLFLAALYFIYILVVCGFWPHLAPPMSSDIKPPTRNAFWMMVIRSFVPPTFLILCVLGSILLGFATPTEASGVGAFGSILLAAFNRKLSWINFVDVCKRTALTTGMIFGIFVGATAFAFVFKSTGGDSLIINFIEHMNVGPWSILFVLMGTIFILGFFFDWVEITLIILPIFAPIITLLDFGGHIGTWQGVSNPIMIWFLILVAMNLQTSFLTPPFGLALFFMKGAAPPEIRIQEMYKGSIPFVGLQMFGLLMCMLFPSIVLWLPSYVLGG